MALIYFFLIMSYGKILYEYYIRGWPLLLIFSMVFICLLITSSIFILGVISLEGRVKLDYILLTVYNIPVTLIFINILTHRSLYLLLTLLALNV